MKGASAATLAIMSTGQYVIAELYDITLPTNQVYHYTSFMTSLRAGIYPSILTVNTYQTGLTIERDTITQKAGIEAGHMKLTISPQPDSPNNPALLAGYPVLQAARYGFLDGATIKLSKLYMNHPAYTNGQYDTSPGAVAWFLGTVQSVDADRVKCEITLDDYMAYLNTQQMPRVLWQAGCFHQVYDSGCTLLKSAFTVSGTIATATDGAHFTTNLTQADDWFALGVMKFTSGALNGQSQNVATYKHTSGAVSLRFPFPQAPTPGDTFAIYPGCDLQQSTCQNKFSNLAHFSGMPYIPVPQTTLDGGTDNPPAQTRGNQAGQIIGSPSSGRRSMGLYRP